MVKRKTTCYILPYRQGSRSAKALADSLHGRVLKLEGSKLIGRVRKPIIAWGKAVGSCAKYFPNYELYEKMAYGINLNHRGHFVNKHKAFTLMSKNERITRLGKKGESPIPPFTTSINSARLLLNDGPVMCRTVLDGHSGEGCVYATKPEELVEAPLYVQYIKKATEWRVHFFWDRAGMRHRFFVQKKCRRHETPDSEVNWKIRNHKNGFVYTSGEDYTKDQPEEVAVLAESVANIAAAYGVFYGAVDIIYNKKKKMAYFLELNLAPGLEGRTLEFYTHNFREHLSLR